MRAQLIVLYGFYAICCEVGRPMFTSFRASVPQGKVLRVVRREHPELAIHTEDQFAFDFTDEKGGGSLEHVG